MTSEEYSGFARISERQMTKIRRCIKSEELDYTGLQNELNKGTICKHTHWHFEEDETVCDFCGHRQQREMTAAEPRCCPKCKGEMDKIHDEDFADDGTLVDVGWFWVCSKCGHEEKVEREL